VAMETVFILIIKFCSDFICWIKACTQI